MRRATHWSMGRRRIQARVEMADLLQDKADAYDPIRSS
jgi:hypothetical protein